MQFIKTALLSYGMSGKLFHAPFLHVLPQFHFQAVWERSKKTVSEKYPSVTSYDTLDELLNDAEIELVIVNTPNYTHYEYAKKALQAGKHVIVEKPFVTTVAEGEELIAIAKEQRKILSVYQNRRYDSDYKTVKKIVDEGWLGAIVEAEIHYDRYKTDLSVRPQKEVPGVGTGVLFDLGSHIIDQAVQLFGMPQAVFGDIRMVRPESKVDDYFEVLLYYPHLRVRLHSSLLVREPLPGYMLHGTEGSFIKAKTNVQEDALNKGILPGSENWGIEPETEKGFLHTEKEAKVIKEHITSEVGGYAHYFVEVYNAIRQKDSNYVTAESGLNVIRIIEAAFQSSKEKRVINL